jgi:hypothetical protein
VLDNIVNATMCPVYTSSFCLSCTNLGSCTLLSHSAKWHLRDVSRTEVNSTNYHCIYPFIRAICPLSNAGEMTSKSQLRKSIDHFLIRTTTPTLARCVNFRQYISTFVWTSSPLLHHLIHVEDLYQKARSMRMSSNSDSHFHLHNVRPRTRRADAIRAGVLPGSASDHILLWSKEPKEVSECLRLVWGIGFALPLWSKQRISLSDTLRGSHETSCSANRTQRTVLLRPTSHQRHLWPRYRMYQRQILLRDLRLALASRRCRRQARSFPKEKDLV